MLEPEAKPTSVVLPTLECGAATDTGPHRDHNEDAFLVRPPVFVVADGMGGHQAGEQASAITVKRFRDLALQVAIDQQDVIDTLDRCRSDIAEIPTTGEAFSHPGTTVVVLVQVVESGAPYWLLAYLGDSRIYQWSSNGLEQLSHDHSIVQELLDAGQISAEAARTHRLRHVVTRSLDGLEETPADFALLPALGESRMLLCSDGITNELSETAIEAIMARGLPPQATADLLVSAAIEAGGRDNATAVVVDVGRHPTVHETVRRWYPSEWPLHPALRSGSSRTEGHDNP